MMAATMAHDAGGESGIAGDAVCGGGDDAIGGGIGGPTTLVDVLKAEALSRESWQPPSVSQAPPSDPSLHCPR